MITKRHFVKWTLVTIALLVVIVQACYWAVAFSANGRVYDSENEIPYNEVGMVLGTGPTTITGATNRFFQYRIDAAEELYKAGKIKFILISGDNSREDYSEPDVMRDSLVRRGIPKDVIYLDYAGFRTWDSVVRANKVFGQKNMTIISQQFHNERSIFIGDRFGMQLIGFNAKDTPSRSHMIRAYIRENFARVKILVDLIIGRQPRYLGEPIEIKEGKPQKETNPIHNEDSHENVSIVDIEALTIYYPHYNKIDLVCGTMPSPNDSTVLLCCEAAFTGELQKEFHHSNVGGNHVSGGKLYNGYRAPSNTGCFAWYADSAEWQFAYNDYAYCLSKAVQHHGMAFGQTMITYNGKDVHSGRPCKDTSKNQYRALCELDGKLCIVDAKDAMLYRDFIQALLKVGAKHALYLDMGNGWNYSYYRDNSGTVNYIHDHCIPYTTNWITFYK